VSLPTPSPPNRFPERSDTRAEGADTVPSDDVFDDLLRGTRNMRHTDGHLRDIWFAKLRAARKEEVLFELETLLKGLGCFRNPRNQPGRRNTPIAAKDFAPHVNTVRIALARIVVLTRTLLAEDNRVFVFQRYLETVVPDDAMRSALSRPDRSTPVGALLALRNGMTNVHEVVSGVARLPRIPFRLFFALLGMATQEIHDSPFFNSLSSLEFRPEFDRIPNPEVIARVRAVKEPVARRLVALTFLSLFRLLRYLALIEHCATSVQPSEQPNSFGILHITWTVVRSDARAITHRLAERAGLELAEAFEHAIGEVKASEISAQFPVLLAEAQRMRAIRATFAGIASNLRFEMRRLFEHELPGPDAGVSDEDFRERSRVAAIQLRPSLQNAIVVLGSALGTRLDSHGVFGHREERQVTSRRLRRDVWMFAQILRAFTEKAKSANSYQEHWDTASPFAFVGEFLVYFRAMGHPLVRAADYERLGPFLDALERVRDVARIDPARLASVAEEAERFRVFLTELFESIGLREELQGETFDRREAAKTLRLYLS
jgi:hypothetical protein